MAHHDTSGLFEDAPVIHSYSRQDAIEDGVLIECPQDLGREAGFVIPIAFTAAAWADAVAWAMMVEGQRLKDIADLPLDLTI